MKKYDFAIKVIEDMLKDFDKGFTIHEYRPEIEELLTCAKFVSHINSHFQEDHPDWDVECKICGLKLNDIRKDNKCQK